MIYEDNWLANVSVKLALMTFGNRSTPPWEDIQPEQTWRKNNKRPKNNLAAGLEKTCSWGTNSTDVDHRPGCRCKLAFAQNLLCLHESNLTYTPEAT